MKASDRSAVEARKVLIRAALGALLAAAIYGIFGFIQIRSFRATAGETLLSVLGLAISPEFYLWIALMTLVTLPAALLSAVTASVAGRAPAAWAIVAHLVLLPAAVVSGTLLFIAYMTELSPRIGWERGWLAPASCIAAYLLQALAVPRLSRGHVQPV